MSERGRATASACGKVILLGEHAVVFGHAALVAGIASRVRVDARLGEGGERRLSSALGEVHPSVARAVEEALRLVGAPGDTGLVVAIDGDLPVAMGLGSSAALSVALLRAVGAAIGRPLSDAEIARGAHRLEAIFHGTPSGVDSTAATYGGLLWFEAGPPPRHEAVRPRRPLEVVIALADRRHDTRRTVGSVRERTAAAPAAYRPVLGAIGALVGAARTAIEAGDLALLGELMSMNHGLLRALGVSTRELDGAVEAALAAGALGAKLTGGGGGGAIVALAAAGGAAELAAALETRGYPTLLAALPAGGAAPDGAVRGD